MSTHTPDEHPRRAGKEWYAAACVCDVCGDTSMSFFPACADDTMLYCVACGNFLKIAVEYLDFHEVAALQLIQEMNVHADCDGDEQEKAQRMIDEALD